MPTASNGERVRAEGASGEKLYTVELGSSDGASESGDSETHLAVEDMPNGGHKNEAGDTDHVDFGGGKPRKKPPVLTVSRSL